MAVTLLVLTEEFGDANSACAEMVTSQVAGLHPSRAINIAAMGGSETFSVVDEVAKLAKHLPCGCNVG